jgi:hypothetical protein
MGHPADRVENRRPGGLDAAVAERDEQVGETRCDEVVDSGPGQPVQPFGFLRTLGEAGDGIEG